MFLFRSRPHLGPPYFVESTKKSNLHVLFKCITRSQRKQCVTADVATKRKSFDSLTWQQETVPERPTHHKHFLTQKERKTLCTGDSFIDPFYYFHFVHKPSIFVVKNICGNNDCISSDAFVFWKVPLDITQS